MSKSEKLLTIMVSLPWTDLLEAAADEVRKIHDETTAADIVLDIFGNIDEDGKDEILSAAQNLYMEHYNEEFKEENQ